jgi:hypothetical protein
MSIYSSPTRPRDPYNPLSVMQPGEEVICEIRRSPIGLFLPYSTSAIIIVVAAVAAVLIPYCNADILTQQAKLGVVLVALLVMAATLLYVYVTTLVYTANRWIVTNDSLTQIAQTGLTATESSQLGLAELEDVTVEQNGILQMFFDFGTLRAVTPADRDKFMLAYCPDPDGYARKLLAAKESLPS